MNLPPRTKSATRGSQCDHGYGRGFCVFQGCPNQGPHPSATEFRWTAYDGLYPVGHAASKAGAVKIAETKGRSVTHVVKRLRAYPFTHIRQEKP